MRVTYMVNEDPDTIEHVEEGGDLGGWALNGEEGDYTTFVDIPFGEDIISVDFVFTQEDLDRIQEAIDARQNI